MHPNNLSLPLLLQFEGKDYWKILLIVITILTTFPLSGDRDCDKGFFQKE